MSKLYRNIILFLLPVFLVVLFIPENKQLKYQGLKDDCFNHGVWIYDRVFRQDKQMDLIFLGSSKTINGINDRLIEAELTTTRLQIANLGYCRLGRNFSYALLREVLEKKSPKYVVLEVRADEDRYSHPIFPYIAQTEDVFFPTLFFNRDLISDVWTHLAYKVALSQDVLYQSTPALPPQTKPFGFSSLPDTARLEILNQYKTKHLQPAPVIENTARRFYMSYPRSYLQKTKSLCEDNGITLLFLYLPSYGESEYLPKEMDTYQSLGEVLTPPPGLLQSTAIWYDEHHLNQSGAQVLSSWLAKELIITLSEEK